MLDQKFNPSPKSENIQCETTEPGHMYLVGDGHVPDSPTNRSKRWWLCVVCTFALNIDQGTHGNGWDLIDRGS